MRVTHFCSPLVVRSVGNVLEPLTPKNKVPAGDMETATVFAKADSAVEVGLQQAGSAQKVSDGFSQGSD